MNGKIFKSLLMVLFVLLACSEKEENQALDQAQTIVKKPVEKIFMADSVAVQAESAKKPRQIRELGKAVPKDELPDSVAAESRFENGNPQMRSVYVGDKSNNHLLIRNWTKEGQLIRELHVINQRRHGTVTKWKLDGTKESETEFVDGVVKGPIISYDDNGVKDQLVTYEGKTKNGLFETYYPDGSIRKRGYYVKDSLQGEYTAWFDDGQIEFTGQYSGDLMQGDWIKYYPTGELKATSQHIDGKREGRYKVYDQRGDLLIDDLYEKGEVTKHF